jgi:hypothetical protein
LIELSFLYLSFVRPEGISLRSSYGWLDSVTRAEKVTGKVGSCALLLSNFVLFIDKVLAIVLGTGADMLEGVETRSGGSIGVDIDNLAALDVLEKSHGSIAGIVLHHSFVVLARTYIKSGVLEDAALPIGALRWMLQKVLADRGKILSAQTLLLLELFLAVGESTALLLLAVFAGLAIEPEAAEFSLDFLLPSVLSFDRF